MLTSTVFIPTNNPILLLLVSTFNKNTVCHLGSGYCNHIPCPRSDLISTDPSLADDVKDGYRVANGICIALCCVTIFCDISTRTQAKVELFTKIMCLSVSPHCEKRRFLQSAVCSRTTLRQEMNGFFMERMDPNAIDRDQHPQKPLLNNTKYNADNDKRKLLFCVRGQVECSHGVSKTNIVFEGLSFDGKAHLATQATQKSTTIR